MFRAIPCSSSGAQIVLLQHLVSSLSVSCYSVHRLRAYYSPLSTGALNSYSWHIWTTSKIDNFLTQLIVPPKSNTQNTIRLSKYNEYSLRLLINFVSYSACSKFNASRKYDSLKFSVVTQSIQLNLLILRRDCFFPKPFSSLRINNSTILRYRIWVAEVVMQKHNVSETQHCFLFFYLH